MVARKQDLNKVLNALHFDKEYVDKVIKEVDKRKRYNDEHIRIKVEGEFMTYLVK